MLQHRIKRTFYVLLMLFLVSIETNAQQIKNLKADYRNDTLSITYDLVGKQKLDSIHLKISSFTSKTDYNLDFAGDIDGVILPGKNKKLFAIINRDSFPENGESLRIQLVGWTKNNPVHSKDRFHFPSIDLSKVPKNPRFTINTYLGAIFPSEGFSKAGRVSTIVLNYNVTNTFMVGLGASCLKFNDSIRTYHTYPLFVNLAYKFYDPAYLFMNLGYCPVNMGPKLTFGIGYKLFSHGPFGFDLSAQLHKYYGNKDILAVSLNSGISFDFSSRKYLKKESYYKFKHDYLIYGEIGLNFTKKACPAISCDIAYIISPFYTQGIGIAGEYAQQ